MGSAFDHLMNTVGAPLLVEQFGDDAQVSYVAPGANGKATHVTAILGSKQADEMTIDGQREKVIRWPAKVRRDPAAGGVENIALSGKFIIDGEDWPVADIARQTDTFTSVILMRTEMLAKAKNNYQRGR